MMYVVIFLIVYLVFCFIVASKFDDIALMKGHEGYFKWCFWLSIIGWMMVIALPDRRIKFPDFTSAVQQNANIPQNSVSETDDSLPTL